MCSLLKTISILAVSSGCVSLTAVQAAAVELVEQGTLQIVTTGNAPPLSVTRPDGLLTGFDVQLCLEIASRLGLEPVVSRMDFSAVLPGLSSGRFDIACTSTARTAQRLESPDILMSDPTIANFTTLVVRADSPLQDVDDVTETPGLRIGVVRGGQEAQALGIYYGSGAYTQVEYPGLSEEVLDLKNGRVDAIAVNAVVASYYTHGDDAVRIITPGLEVEGMSPYYLGLVMSASAPELHAEVNRLLAEFREDGTFDTLVDEWISIQ